ncbi:MAG: hypothetical protein MJZ75_07170 [Paludibacteraceae bacterium]|nr:hypothetical protein [Paludibacteraceae bacterium]
MKKTMLMAALLLVSVSMSAAEYEHSIGVSAGGFNGLSFKEKVTEHFAVTLDIGVKVSQTKGYSWLLTIEDPDANKAFQQERKDLNIATNGNYKDGFIYYTAEINPNFLYQTTVATTGIASIDMFVGGGLSVGMMQSGWKTHEVFPEGLNRQSYDYDLRNNLTCDFQRIGSTNWSDLKHVRQIYADAAEIYSQLPEDEQDWALKYKKSQAYAFKAGINAMVGVEMNFANVPLSLSAEFRPGYGEAIYADPIKYVTKSSDNGEIPIIHLTKIQNMMGFFDWSLGLSLRYRL